MKGAPKTGGEGGRGLVAHAGFRAGDPCGVAGEEVVHGLFGRKPGDRRQNTEGIGSQHHHVFGDAAKSGLAGVGDEIERVAGAGVLREAVVVEVQRPGLGIDHDVFQQGAEAPGGGVDFRLRLGREIDHLGIAAAFEVEDAAVRPAMLVIADQNPRGVGGESGLAGAREAEEDRGVAVGPDVGRAMHRQHVAFGQQVVQHREDRFLDLAGIDGAADDDQTLGQVDDDEAFAVGAVRCRIGMAAWRMQDGEARLKIDEIGFGRTNEHVVGEEAVPGTLGDDAHRQAIGGIGTGIEVLDIEIAGLEMTADLVQEPVEMRFAHAAINVAPPDIAGGAGLLDNEFVIGGPAGVGAGAHHQGAAIGHHAGALAHGMLDEGCCHKIPMGRLAGLQALLFKAVAADDPSAIAQSSLHLCLSFRSTAP